MPAKKTAMKCIKTNPLQIVAEVWNGTLSQSKHL